MTRFTLWGLYQYDSSLFDDVILPDGLSKEMCIDNIIDKSGDLYLYYQVPDRAKAQITRWFSMHYVGFKRMIDTLLTEYNPIENTDRVEEETRTLDTTRTNQASGNDSVQLSGSDINKNQALNTSEVETSAFDSGDYQPKDLTTDNVDDTSTTTYGRKDTNTYGRKDDLNGNDTEHRVLKYHGNLGTMTNQFMVREELELRKYNIYDVIAQMFENDILVQIY